MTPLLPRFTLLLAVLASACPSRAPVTAEPGGTGSRRPAIDAGAGPDVEPDVADALSHAVGADCDDAECTDAAPPCPSPPCPPPPPNPSPTDCRPSLADCRVPLPAPFLPFGMSWDWRRPTADTASGWVSALGAERPASDGWARGDAPFVGIVVDPAHAEPEVEDGTALEVPAAEGEGASPGPFVWHFAQDFDVVDPSAVVAALAEVRFAGGFVAYLNGEEWFRSNIDPARGGLADPADVAETPRWYRETRLGIWQRAFPGLDPSRLRETGNVLVVEVHRVPEAVGPPVYFDLRLSLHRQSGFTKTPWLEDPRADGVTVSWETVTPTLGEIRFGEGEAFDRHADDFGRCVTHHEVRIDGLTPGVDYAYGIEPAPCDQPSAVAWSLFGTLRAAPAPGEPFTFLAYGDSRSNPQKHGALIERMLPLVSTDHPAFLINTGDLTMWGNSYVDWQEQFFNPVAPLVASVPLVPVLGNHDGQNESWYDWFALPGNEAYFSFRAGDAELFVLDAYAGLQARSEQVAWLDGALEASDAPWKIVVVHQPLRSCMRDRARRRAADQLRESLGPTLVEHGVRLVFAGHDHAYGRSKEIDGFTVVTTGGGGAGLYTVRLNDEHVTCASVVHFCVVRVSRETIHVRTIDVDGNPIDEFEISGERDASAGDE